MCEPEQASLMMGGLHPRGSLYERPINIDIAKVFLRALPLSGPTLPAALCTIAHSAHGLAGTACRLSDPASSAWRACADCA